MNDYINNFTEIWKKVITNPTEFYKNMPIEGGYMEPLKFAITNFIVFGIGSALINIFNNMVCFLFYTTQTDFLIYYIKFNSFFYLILIPLFCLIGLFISGAILFIFFKIVGGTGTYEGTVRILSYSSAVNLLAWIPLLGWLIGLYQLYLIIIGGKFVHNLSTTISAIVVLIPTIIVLSLAIIYFIFFGMSIIAMIGQSGWF